MASKDISMNINKIVAETGPLATVTLHLSGVRWFSLRLKAATLLFRLAGFVAGKAIYLKEE